MIEKLIDLSLMRDGQVEQIALRLGDDHIAVMVKPTTPIRMDDASAIAANAAGSFTPIVHRFD